MARRRRVEAPAAGTGDDVMPSVPAPGFRIRLTRPHGYYDDDGVQHYWHTGYVADADESEHLMERGAAHEILE